MLGLPGLLAFAAAVSAQHSPEKDCGRLARTPIANAHSILTRYLRAGESYRVPGSCGVGLGEDLRAQTAVDVCVVNVVYNTSRTSATRIEAWLPDANGWSGRLLGTGGAGLGGCVDYADLNYGTSLRFAAFGSDGGHDGDNGIALAEDEVLKDYAGRALHVSATTAKQLVRAYYGRPQQKTYYIGCSNGGRQGFHAVQTYPADFDGVLAGAPALNMAQLIGAATFHNIAQAKLSDSDWTLVRAELLKQCDGIDGVENGYLDDPDQCAFLPEALLCGGKKRPDCLSVEQVDALRTIYAPLHGNAGELLLPRKDPGAEGDVASFNSFYGTPLGPLMLGWFRYAVYKDPNWKPNNTYGLKDVYAAVKRDAAFDVNSFNPDLSAFRKRGGKLLTYHGRRDLLIPAGNSLRYYQSVSRKLALPPAKLDDFYRLFLIPGMNHCLLGPGAWRFGHVSALSSWSNASDSNALLALVDWVEKDKAPETLRGATDDATSTRLHCKYPARSVWKPDVKDWVCV